MASRKKRGKADKQKRNSRNDAPAERPRWSKPHFLYWPLAASLLLWAAQAPLSLAPLAWLAPVGWLRATELSERPGWRGYFALWISGCVYWLSVLQGIRLAYWPLYAGWAALSLYLAIYVPLFVGSTRLMLARGVPLVVAAPISWAGWEMLRCYVISGYSANSLAHTQASFPTLVQSVDQFGIFGVGFLMVLVAAAVYQGWMAYSQKQEQLTERAQSAPDKENTFDASVDASGEQIRRGGATSWVPAIVAATSLFVVNMGYGIWRIRQADELAQASPLFRVLLVQENTPTMFESDLGTLDLAWDRYLDTTRDQVSRHEAIDLVVWPESTFSAGRPWVKPEIPAEVPAEYAGQGLDRDFMEEWIRRATSDFDFRVARVLRATNGRPDGMTPMLLLGSDAVELNARRAERFNSAIVVNGQGAVVDVYHKMHRVMFGEYIPLGPVLQWLRDLFGMPGIEAGDAPIAFDVAGVRVAPNICFETMMPRVVSGQLRTLKSANKLPEVLVNVTNDSWFRGSSMLDHHLACSRLCAIETRRPLLVAANTGISAEIDGSGRVVQSLGRGEVGGVLAVPRRDGRNGLVQVAGYPFGWICAFFAVLPLVLNVARKRPSPA